MSRSASPSEQRVGQWRYPTLALLLACLAALPLLAGPGFLNTRAGGDSPFLLLRVHQMSKALREGAFPVRWMPDAAYGLGYPAYRYYAALPYYIASALDLSGLGVLWGIKITQLLGFLLAGGMAYLLAHQLGLAPPGALLASGLYTFAPFHLVNVYVRGDSLGEFWAMGLFPLILWALGRLRARPSIARTVVAALAFAALVLSHNVSALLFSPFVALWVLFGASLRSRPGRLWLAWAAGAIALGLALSAWFWVPALGEQHLVQLSDQTTGFFHYAGHFRGGNLLQWNLAHDYAISAQQTPFNMGLLQGFVAVAGLVAALRLALRRRLTPGVAWAGATLLLATLMITPWSRPIWDHLPLLSMAQFPWRFLSIQALAIALLGGLLPELLPRRGPLAVSLAGCALAAFAGLAGLRLDRLPLREADITPQRLMLYETYSGNIGGTVRYEYLPREMSPRPYASGVQLNAGAKPPPLALTGRIAEATLLSQRSHGETWQITVLEPTQLAFHTTCIAGWRALVNGQEQAITCLPGLGLIGLRLEAGTYQIVLTLHETPLGRAAGAISLVGLLLAAAGLAWALRTSRRRMLAALSCLGALGLWLAWVSWWAPTLAGAEASGPLLIDTLRAPYLHHESEPVSLGAVRLLNYHLSCTQYGPGENLEIEIAWDGDWPTHDVQLTLVGATAHLFDEAPTWATVEAPIHAAQMTLSLPLPENIPPGLYAVRVRVLHNGKDQPLRTAQGIKLAKLALEPVQIVGTRFASGQEAALGAFGPSYEPPVISLLGAQVVSRGERSLEATLTWRGERQAAVNYALSLRLLRPDGSQAVARDVPPMLGGYPTSLWKPGELLTDRIILEWPAEEPVSPDYSLEIVLYDRYTMQAAGAVRLPSMREHGWR